MQGPTSMDPISELQKLTVLFLQQMQVIVDESLLQCPMATDSNESVVNEHIAKVCLIFCLDIVG